MFKLGHQVKSSSTATTIRCLWRSATLPARLIAYVMAGSPLHVIQHPRTFRRNNTSHHQLTVEGGATFAIRVIGHPIL